MRSIQGTFIAPSRYVLYRFASSRFAPDAEVEAELEAPASVEMTGVLDQRFDLRVGQADSGEVGIVQG